MFASSRSVTSSGVISSIERKVGSNVNKGDVVLYLEAMKMLNDIVAPRPVYREL
jgi:biotin carboxyl carrier protein